MNCPNCGNVIEPNKRFCGRCGTSLPSTLNQGGSKTGESQKAVAFLVIAVLGTLAFCVISGVLFYIYNEKTDNEMPPEQRLSKILQSNDRWLIEKQIGKLPKDTPGREDAVRHYFDVLKSDALQSEDPDTIRSIMGKYNSNSPTRAEIQQHLYKVENNLQKKAQQDEASSELASIAGMRYDDENVVGNEAIVSYKFLIGNPSASLMATEFLELVYDVSCKLPQIKTVKVKLIMLPTGVVDKYGNEVKEDTEICTLSFSTDPEAPKYKDAYYWRTKGNYDEVGLVAANMCMNNPELRSYIECDK